ncbi:MAG: hypothetical protein WAW80_04265 [Candidatus Saccharimonadales bacterium]
MDFIFTVGLVISNVLLASVRPVEKIGGDQPFENTFYRVVACPFLDVDTGVNRILDGPLHTFNGQWSATFFGNDFTQVVLVANVAHSRLIALIIQIFDNLGVGKKPLCA